MPMQPLTLLMLIVGCEEGKYTSSIYPYRNMFTPLVYIPLLYPKIRPLRPHELIGMAL
jgi:hypothetical protein